MVFTVAIFDWFNHLIVVVNVIEVDCNEMESQLLIMSSFKIPKKQQLGRPHTLYKIECTHLQTDE